MAPHKEPKVLARGLAWLRSGKFNFIMLAVFTLGMVSLWGMGSAYAWLSSASQVDNIINTPPLKVTIQEGNTDTDINGWDPKPINWGDSVPKFVRFTNTGEASILLRVNFSQTWTRLDGSTVVHLSNVVSTNNGLITLATPNWTGLGLDKPDYWWYNATDGWYYYRMVLDPGQEIGPVMNGVTFAAMPEGYYAARYDLRFLVEAVQYSTRPSNENLTAAQTTFGVSFTESGGVLTWSN